MVWREFIGKLSGNTLSNNIEVKSLSCTVGGVCLTYDRSQTEIRNQEKCFCHWCYPNFIRADIIGYQEHPISCINFENYASYMSMLINLIGLGNR